MPGTSIPGHVAMAKAILRRPLATALVAALGCAASASWATERANDGPIDMSAMVERLPYVHERLSRSASPSRDVKHVATTHYVDTCADDGSPNSLRSLIELSLDVHSGDTIDLTQLPMMCSKITLSDTFPDPAITVGLDTLYLQGPGADQLTIDANGVSSVFRHYGSGKLQVEGLTIANGNHKTSGPPQTLPRGGCIFSTADVVLIESAVTNCKVESTAAYYAQGGGIYSRNLRMYFSSLTGNRAVGSSLGVQGGGAMVSQDITISYSAVSANAALAGAPFVSWGGGLFVDGAAAILGSTISSNVAETAGGIQLGSSGSEAYFTNSTVSGNIGTDGVGGVDSAEHLVLINSSVVFNRSNDRFVGGIFVWYSTITLQSSIVAANTGSDINAPDIYLHGTAVDPQSKNNLIVGATFSSLPDTISDCPRLDPLMDNGGPTLTHSLNHASPAIDHGNNDTYHLDSDQRQAARVSGASADIGAVERRPSDKDERIFLGGFDAKCEW